MFLKNSSSNFESFGFKLFTLDSTYIIANIKKDKLDIFIIDINSGVDPIKDKNFHLFDYDPYISAARLLKYGDVEFNKKLDTFVYNLGKLEAQLQIKEEKEILEQREKI